jgi:hypothetical protein
MYKILLYCLPASVAPSCLFEPLGHRLVVDVRIIAVAVIFFTRLSLASLNTQFVRYHGRWYCHLHAVYDKVRRKSKSRERMIKPCGSACAVSKMKNLWFKRKEEKEMRDISNIVAVDDRYLDRSVCVLQLQRCSPQVRLTRTFGMREPFRYGNLLPPQTRPARQPLNHTVARASYTTSGVPAPTPAPADAAK